MLSYLIKRFYWIVAEKTHISQLRIDWIGACSEFGLFLISLQRWQFSHFLKTNFYFQCSTSSNSQGHVLNSPRIEREAILSTNSSDKLLENESQNSVLHRSSSTATSSLVLNPDDEIPINESETNTVIIPSAGK